MQHSFLIRSNSIDKDQLSKDTVSLHWGSCMDFISYYDSMFESISKEEKEQANRIKHKTVNTNYVISHFLLRKELANVLKINDDRIIIDFTRFTKPKLLNREVDFNLSHSEKKFVFIIGGRIDNELGVDIEKIAEIEGVQNIISNYYHAEEIAYVLGGDTKKQQLIRFYVIWTRKEAFLKMIGIGLIKELSAINMLGMDNKFSINFANEFIIESNIAYIQTIVKDQFIMSISSTKPFNLNINDY